jgi:serine/threonine protein kinase
MLRTIRPETGSFKILELLGEGSTGRIYKAEKVDSRGFSKQIVALKILKSETEVQSLVHEMSVLQKVRSNHCVSVLGWENLAEGPALVIEWVDGVNLDVLARHRRLSERCILEIAIQIQRGLKDLADSGLFHGDLSSSNIIVDRAGCVKLVDFGLIGKLGAIVGTARFMSPERWQGFEPSLKDDIFSLGLILKDLRSSQLEATAPSDFWRERAFKVRDHNSSWLNENPDRRGFVELVADHSARSELAQIVEDVQLSHRLMAKTMILPETSRSFSHAFRATFLTLLIFCFPIAPFGQSRSFSVANATLEVKTLEWVHVQLGLLDLGYSPISRTGLPTGLHVLRWKTKRGQGSKTLSLGYNERKVLTDSDFR